MDENAEARRRERPAETTISTAPNTAQIARTSAGVVAPPPSKKATGAAEEPAAPMGGPDRSRPGAGGHCQPVDRPESGFATNIISSAPRPRPAGPSEDWRPRTVSDTAATPGRARARSRGSRCRAEGLVQGRGGAAHEGSAHHDAGGHVGRAPGAGQGRPHRAGVPRSRRDHAARCPAASRGSCPVSGTGSWTSASRAAALRLEAPEAQGPERHSVRGRCSEDRGGASGLARLLDRPDDPLGDLRIARCWSGLRGRSRGRAPRAA